MLFQMRIILKLYKSLGEKVRAKTLSEIKLFFMQYRYDQSFTREDVKGFFNVKNSRASEIVATLLNSNIIENIDGGKYKFRK